jgi:hypothetical protein
MIRHLFCVRLTNPMSLSSTEYYFFSEQTQRTAAMSEQQREIGEPPQQHEGNNSIIKENLKEPSGVDRLPMNLMKSLQRKTTSESGSSNGGDNSDNSALISLGYTSFGFNFDSEENGSEERNDQSDDSDGNGPSDMKVPLVTSSSDNTVSGSGMSRPQHLPRQNLKVNPMPMPSPSMSSMTNSSITDGAMSVAAHRQAAAKAVAKLQSIANSVSKNLGPSDGKPAARPMERKRKAGSVDGGDSGGYNTDDERNDNDQNSNDMKSCDGSAGSGDTESNDRDQIGGRKKKKKLNERKREQRNAREKERSFRISHQIDELRALLSSGGVIVPKGTKSSILVEAANYIRVLQQHQYRSEM